ncbi:hypothetical protein EDD36DRAFT_423925 [Exophiala viscosa]|uniref:ABM domain-containing protein n=1 Tax=Exophiala viscosa TaxID=2486360 RepID=A0AAN6DMH7_9EURO|nr:hypothetical protein EDD36DRAFT_423925 [Exophiala viscosa]
MSVTELALLRIDPGTDVSSPTLLANLSEAKSVMERASGFKFHYYHCVEDPSLVFILGAWPSIDFHMKEFIPGEANQEILDLLKRQLVVEWMFHLDVDQAKTALSLSEKFIAIGRHFIREGEEDVFRSTFKAKKHELESFIGGAGHVVGGFRLDDGFEPATEGDRKEEFVLFTAWNSVEHHFGFARTEGFEKYGQIRNHIEQADIKHATRLNVDEKTRV